MHCVRGSNPAEVNQCHQVRTVRCAVRTSRRGSNSTRSISDDRSERVTSLHLRLLYPSTAKWEASAIPYSFSSISTHCACPTVRIFDHTWKSVFSSFLQKFNLNCCTDFVFIFRNPAHPVPKFLHLLFSITWQRFWFDLYYPHIIDSSNANDPYVP